MDGRGIVPTPLTEGELKALDRQGEYAGALIEYVLKPIGRFCLFVLGLICAFRILRRFQRDLNRE